MITHKKLQPLQCYHIFSDSRDVYLSKNCYEHYSPRMVPVAEISGSGSWPIRDGKNAAFVKVYHLSSLEASLENVTLCVHKCRKPLLGTMSASAYIEKLPKIQLV